MTETEKDFSPTHTVWIENGDYIVRDEASSVLAQIMMTTRDESDDIDR